MLCLVSFSGVVTLLKEHTVCKEGSVLTPEQARLLVMIESFPLALLLGYRPGRAFVILLSLHQQSQYGKLEQCIYDWGRREWLTDLVSLSRRGSWLPF